MTLITDKELCEQILKCDRKTTWRLRKRRRYPLPAYRIGGRIFYDPEEVEDWIKKNKFRVS